MSDTPIPDYCRKCGAETTRVDRLCDDHHEDAIVLSEMLRRAS